MWPQRTCELLDPIITDSPSLPPHQPQKLKTHPPTYGHSRHLVKIVHFLTFHVVSLVSLAFPPIRKWYSGSNLKAKADQPCKAFCQTGACSLYLWDCLQWGGATYFCRLVNYREKKWIWSVNLCTVRRRNNEISYLKGFYISSRGSILKTQWANYRNH